MTADRTAGSAAVCKDSLRSKITVFWTMHFVKKRGLWAMHFDREKTWIRCSSFSKLSCRCLMYALMIYPRPIKSCCLSTLLLSSQHVLNTALGEILFETKLDMDFLLNILLTTIRDNFHETRMKIKVGKIAPFRFSFLCCTGGESMGRFTAISICWWRENTEVKRRG